MLAESNVFFTVPPATTCSQVAVAAMYNRLQNKYEGFYCKMSRYAADTTDTSIHVNPRFWSLKCVKTEFLTFMARRRWLRRRTEAGECSVTERTAAGYGKE